MEQRIEEAVAGGGGWGEEEGDHKGGDHGRVIKVDEGARGVMQGGGSGAKIEIRYIS